MVKRSVFAAAVFCIAIPAAAQNAMNKSQVLECAAFGAAMTGSAQDKDVQAGVGFYTTWLIGRYEGMTGQPIDADLKRRSLELTQKDLVALQPACGADMQAFGKRMTSLGAEISAAATAPKK